MSEQGERPGRASDQGPDEEPGRGAAPSSLQLKAASTFFGVSAILHVLAWLSYSSGWSMAYTIFVLGMAITCFNIAVEPDALFRPFTVAALKASTARRSPLRAALDKIASASMLLALLLWLTGN